jgi:hypothetical protein
LLGWLLSLGRGVLIAFDMRFLGQCSITTAAGARFEHNEQYMNIWLDGGLPDVFESAWYMYTCSLPRVCIFGLSNMQTATYLHTWQLSV